jgi:hypothetical protein
LGRKTRAANICRAISSEKSVGKFGFEISIEKWNGKCREEFCCRKIDGDYLGGNIRAVKAGRNLGREQLPAIKNEISGVEFWWRKSSGENGTGKVAENLGGEKSMGKIVREKSLRGKFGREKIGGGKI